VPDVFDKNRIKVFQFHAVCGAGARDLIVRQLCLLYNFVNAYQDEKNFKTKPAEQVRTDRNQQEYYW
jgi:hypothetical protein